MINKERQFYEFGPFRIDPDHRLLLRENQPVPLQPKAFDILLVLVENSERVVLKDDLVKSVWPDTFVEESNLSQHIFVLRKTLGDAVEEKRYIVTVPGRGYRFAERVSTVAAAPAAEEEIEVRSRSLSRVVVQQEMVPLRNLALTEGHRRIRPVLLWAGLVVAVVAAVLFRPFVPAPRVWRIRQLTHMGDVAYNTSLVTDGPRIYFRAWIGGKRVIRYVSPEGGEVFPVEGPLPEMDIHDISPSGAEFLVNDLSDSGGSAGDDNFAFWRVPASPGSPRRLGGVRARDAKWSPDGSTIAFTHDTSLYLVNSDGTNSGKLVSLPGEPYYPNWSPDGRRIRCSVYDPRGRGNSLWQADIEHKTVRPLLPDWPISTRPRTGRWTPDGRYFFFTAIGEGYRRDVWAMREPQGSWRRVNPQPVQLTFGPPTFHQPTPSKDGKSIFVVGQQNRGQLVRYDRASGRYLIYPKEGISADHVAFSRDGQWMAYVEYPPGDPCPGSHRRK